MSYERLRQLFANKAVTPSPFEVGAALSEYIQNRKIPYTAEPDDKVLELLGDNGYPQTSESYEGSVHELKGETPQELRMSMIIAGVQTALRLHHPVREDITHAMAAYQNPSP